MESSNLVARLRAPCGDSVVLLTAEASSNKYDPLRLEAADEIERLTAFVTKLANPDFSHVSSFLGPLHAAGICTEAEIVAKLAKQVLAGEWQPAAPESRDG